MASCCCTNSKTDKIAVSCLGRCDLPKHRCLDKEDITPGRIPPQMGWLYTARDSPEHQLRCGWRPGHISCPVLRRIEANACASSCGKCYSCLSACGRPCSAPCYRPVRCTPAPCLPCPPRRCLPCPRPPRCYPASCLPRPRYCVIPFGPSRTRCLPSPCPSRVKCLPGTCASKPKCYPSKCTSRCFVATCSPPSCFQPCESPCNKPMVRIIRHNGRYNIITKPDDISNHPSGPYPLKYVIDTDEYSSDAKAKFCIEAKFNDQHFDYTSSQSSFVLDFSPPDEKCYKPCPRRSSVCFPCQKDKDSIKCSKCGECEKKSAEEKPPSKPAEKSKSAPEEKSKSAPAEKSKSK